MNPKQRAAEAALAYVESGQLVGLGTGSTSDFFIVALARALNEGRLKNIRCVPTSRQSEIRATELGIHVIQLPPDTLLDVTVDGADEISPELNLIKGLGGALLREKIVAQQSKRLVIIADVSKRVTVLGSKSPLPVEVVPFAHDVHLTFFKSLGARPTLRTGADGTPFVTDNGNYIYDCRFPTGMPDPKQIESAMNARAGIVHTGLFLSMATVALVATDDDVMTLERNG